MPRCGKPATVVDNEAVLPLLRRTDWKPPSSAPAAAPPGPPAASGVLIEELTDREQAVLRALTGDATQREIGAALYLSINTVKGYTKVLYRKLGVVTRAGRRSGGARPRPDLKANVSGGVPAVAAQR